MSATLQQRLLAVLASVAPDVDPAGVDPEVDLREQFDFDSMDLLNFATGLKREFGVDVPDKDLRELSSLARCTRYLLARMPPTG